MATDFELVFDALTLLRYGCLGRFRCELRDLSGRSSRTQWQVGHRGSHLATPRAITSLMVMKLSSKWRSGRDGLRIVGCRPSGRGGKMPHAFGSDERVAA